MVVRVGVQHKFHHLRNHPRGTSIMVLSCLLHRLLPERTVVTLHITNRIMRPIMVHPRPPMYNNKQSWHPHRHMEEVEGMVHLCVIPA